MAFETEMIKKVVLKVKQDATCELKDCHASLCYWQPT